MIGFFKRHWHKAQALSALQMAYQQPLKEPLDRLVEADLQAVMRLVIQAGGTPFDTAASYMVLRADAAVRAGLVTEDAMQLGRTMGVSWSIRDRMKLWDQHMAGFARVGDMANTFRQKQPPI